ncbi:xanthine dehydrogenase accessory protein XdhC [Paralcaligenes ginsengisoli]
MHDWITETQRLLASGVPVVLVTIARAEGSTPREAGAKLLVTDRQQWQTIGGGHLEWRAAEIAREMLRSESAGHVRHVERLSLGPSLGQCCGGAATLVFERLAPSDLEWVSTLAQRVQAGQACTRTVMLTDAGPVVLGDPKANANAMPGSPREACLLWHEQGRSGFSEIIAPPDFHIVLFGAGHVGQALVRILATLPCTVSWVDERDAQFPSVLPANVSIEATDTPEVLIAQAPPRSYFLVMTHSHALDQHLCQHIFLRRDFAYFGLIGSRTKRRKFERRLQERGVPAERLAQMICPIGVEGLADKRPEVIAIAVAAQLLRVHEQQETTPASHLDALVRQIRTIPSRQDATIE